MHGYFSVISPIAVAKSSPWQSDALHPVEKCLLKQTHLNVISVTIIANQQMLPSTESAGMEIDKISFFFKYYRFCFLCFWFVCLFNSSKNKSYHIKINNECPVTESPRMIPN